MCAQCRGDTHTKYGSFEKVSNQRGLHTTERSKEEESTNSRHLFKHSMLTEKI